MSISTGQPIVLLVLFLPGLLLAPVGGAVVPASQAPSPNWVAIDEATSLGAVDASSLGESLTLVTSDDAVTVAPGETVSIPFTLGNEGGDTSDHPRIQAKLPGDARDWTVVAHEDGGGEWLGRGIGWHFETIQPSGFRTTSVTLQVPPDADPGTYRLTAIAEDDGGAGDRITVEITVIGSENTPPTGPTPTTTPPPAEPTPTTTPPPEPIETTTPPTVPERTTATSDPWNPPETTPGATPATTRVPNGSATSTTTATVAPEPPARRTKGVPSNPPTGWVDPPSIVSSEGFFFFVSAGAVLRLFCRACG